MQAFLALGALALSAGCRTIETRQVSATHTPLVRVGTRARSWEVRDGGELVGQVVLFQEQGFARDSIYVVRNPWQQDLGLIDGLGRAYRYIPYREEPSWVGSGTIAQGVARILDLHADCALIEVDADETGAGPDPGSAAQEAAQPADRGALPALVEPAPVEPAGPPPDGGLAPGL